MKHALKSNELFLEGDKLSIGINSLGSLGTKLNAPDGFDTDNAYRKTGDSGYLRIGMLSRIDGFQGEKMLLGTAEEGFMIGYEIQDVAVRHRNAERNVLNTKANPIRGTNEDTSAGGRLSGVFKGQSADGYLEVTQAMSFHPADAVVRVDVTLKNAGAKRLEDLRYVRSLDPDPSSGNFNTSNTILRQRAGATISAVDTKSGVHKFFMHSMHPGASVTAVSFKALNSLYDLGAYGIPPNPGPVTSGDSLLLLAVNIGDIEPGGEETFTYWFGFVPDVLAAIAVINAVAMPPEIEPEPAPLPVTPPPPKEPPPPPPKEEPAPPVEPRTVVLTQDKPFANGTKKPGQIALTDKTRKLYPELAGVKILRWPGAPAGDGKFRYTIVS